MTILDLFGGRNPQAQTMAPQNPANPAQPHNQSQGTQVPVTQIGGLQNTQTQGQVAQQNPNQSTGTEGNKENHPLSKYDDLFTVDQTRQNPQQPSFTLAPDKLNEFAQSQDFVTQSLTNEDAAKIMAGGEEAVKAMANVMNKVAQSVFTKTAQFAAKSSEVSFNESKKFFETGVGSSIRSVSAMEELYSAHPGLRTPAAQVHIQTIQKQIADKHPNATSTEVAGMVKEYMTGIAGLFAPQEDPKTAKTPAATDWSQYVA